MSPLFTVIVIILAVLAIIDLIVGVSNDAINFLNSALGSKVAKRWIILTVAAAGILLGVLTSNGMMEVARNGVFHPEMFTFENVMILFVAVMLADVVLLNTFNALGLPTSTTVSLIFELRSINCRGNVHHLERPVAVVCRLGQLHQHRKSYGDDLRNPAVGSHCIHRGSDFDVRVASDFLIQICQIAATLWRNLVRTRNRWNRLFRHFQGNEKLRAYQRRLQPPHQ